MVIYYYQDVVMELLYFGNTENDKKNKTHLWFVYLNDH